MPRMGTVRRQAQYEDDDDEIEQSQPSQKRARMSIPGASQADGASQKRRGRPSNASQRSAAEDDSSDEDEDDADADPEAIRILSTGEIKQRTKMTALIPRLAKPKLTMHVSEYDNANTKMERVFEYLGDAALAVEELFEEGETDLISELDQGVKEAIDSKFELGLRSRVLKGLITSLEANRELISPVQIYNETVQKALERYRAKTSRQRYVKSEDYQRFRSNIWEVHNSGNAMPSLNEVIPAEPGDQAEDEVEDFEQGSVAQNFRCPITTALLEDPVTSTLCPHSYSRAGIEAYFEQIKREHRPATCPVTGCTVVLSPQTIKPDANLAKRVAIHVRRQQTQATQGIQSGAAGSKGKKAGASAKQEDAIEEADEGNGETSEEEIELD